MIISNFKVKNYINKKCLYRWMIYFLLFQISSCSNKSWWNYFTYKTNKQNNKSKFMLFHQKYLVKIFMSPNHHEFFAFDYIIYKKIITT